MLKGLNNPDLDAAVGEDLAQQLRDELELGERRGLTSYDERIVPCGRNHPGFSVLRWVTSALIICWMAWWTWAPAPMPRQTDTRTVEASEDKFTGLRI